MKAMVLAAGLGVRMRPLTDARAKPSLPLLNRPIIVQTLAYLKRHGVTDAVINLHHQPESIRGLVGDGSRLGIKVQYSDEQTILGTGGGLKKAEAHFKDGGTFILINSDFASDCDLGAALRDHQASKAIATLILTPHRKGTAYGNVEIDGEGRILSIAGRPVQPGAAATQTAATGQPDATSQAATGDQPSVQSGYTFTGIHILEPKVFELIPAGVPYEINRDVYPALMQQGALIRGYLHHGLWREMGTPRLYLDGSMALLGEGVDPALQAFRHSDGVYLEEVKLPATSTFAAPLLVGRGTVVGPNSSLLGGVVIGRQCQLGSDCAVRSSILWDGARLGNRVQLTDCIVTSGVYLSHRTSLSGRILFRVDGYQGKKEHLERVGSCWAARIQ